MSVIEEVRREREDLARVLKKHRGIRKIVEDLYPDSAHFIYELLQNAEDTGATEANFKLSNKGLTFEHNGRPFELKDIYSITDIGEGSKDSDDDKIGRFGVGFKAVFAYTETPQIWSPTFSFKITDLVLPSALDSKPGLGTKTRFEFPFNNPKKTPDTAYAEVREGLNDLAETTLLFLSHLKSIRWQIDSAISGEVQRVQHPDNHFEVLKRSGGTTTASSHYLKFDRPVEGLEKQRVAVAFALDFLPNIQQFDPKKPLAKQLKIVPATPGLVAVFFPAEKETSGLRFHLHAPFVPELSRASIKDTPANKPLFDQLATLTAAALHEVRDLRLLTAEFLAVLPNPQDPVPVRYRLIRSAIIEEMNTQKLTPTYAKSYAPARCLLQAKASLKDLLSEDDIGLLVKKGALLWAISAAQKNSNADRFLTGLDICAWDVEEFAKLLADKAGEVTRRILVPPYWVTGPDQEFMTWLSSKPVEWHQTLYSLLYTELSPPVRSQRLKALRIVRLSNGHYSAGNKCFFPGEGIELDEVLLRVDAGTYTSGKNKTQQDSARKLLEEIGVRNVGEAEQVEAILRHRYINAKLQPKKQDLERFIALVERDPSKAGLFANYFIFQGKDGLWRKPDGVFLDQPFMDTGLSAYYDALGKDAKRVALVDDYKDRGIAVSRLVKFAEAIGARTRLEIDRVSCRQNPKSGYLVFQAPGNPSVHKHDEDYQIDAIEKIISQKSVNLSRVIWKSISSSPTSWTQARYCANLQQPYRVAPSRLAALLTETEWIPQGNDNFVRPRDASEKLLPKGFLMDKGWGWLKDIGFGESESKLEQERARQSEEFRKRDASAKALGFVDDESLERAKRFAALPREEQDRFLHSCEIRPTAELPDHEPGNPQRRAERVGAQASDAPERQTEVRNRSVSVGREEVKEGAAQYLRQQYTNADGEMICQVCKAPLPFKLDDGTDYFEKVEFLTDLKKRHYQNYLALCPNHAAMFQYANGSTELIREMFSEIAGNELEVVLAQQDAAIYFTKTHIADIHSVLEAEKEIVTTEDSAGTGPDEF